MPPASSTMLALGTPCPAFTLPDFGVDGSDGNTRLSNQDLSGAEAVVFMFICNHCPYVKHVDPALVALEAEFAPRGVRFVAISSNNVETHPQDAPPRMTQEARKVGYRFPYLYDETQEVAKAFGAACTPDFYIFDQDLRLAYRGRLDGSTPGNGLPVTGEELRAGIEGVLRGDEPLLHQKPSLGCSIKWKQAR